MQTIQTKTLGATAHRGERIRATHSGNVETITNPFNYGWDWRENHQNAARQLMHKLGWGGEMKGGTTLAGMTWMFVHDDTLIIKGSSQNQKRKLKL